MKNTQTTFQSETDAKKIMVKNRPHTAQVEFGTLTESNECDGFGVCRVQMQLGNGSLTGCDFATGWLVPKDRYWVWLEFETGSMKPCTLNRHFATDEFPIYKDVAVGSDLCSAMGCRSMTLLTGVYALQKTEKTVRALVRMRVL